MKRIALNELVVPSGGCGGTAAGNHANRHDRSAEGRGMAFASMSVESTAAGVYRPEANPFLKRSLAAQASMLLLRGLFRRVIRKGALTLIAPGGCCCNFGQGAPSITMRIADQATMRRLFLNPNLALGEAYMDGTLVVEGGDIYDLLVLCFANLGWGTGHWAQRVKTLGRRLGQRIAQRDRASLARANVAHHYDLSDTLYELFLDSGRQYSCAYYMSPDDTLERAQAQKIRHIEAKLLLRPGNRVLDIGSGWGGLALHLARNADVDVTGVTLSTEQHRYSNQRAADASLSDCAKFLLTDYRDEAGRYDRIVSVGMFEHVGVGHYREYFEKVRDLLADDGVALIHTIGSAGGPGAANAWIHKYIFPGGYTPALSEIVPVIERAGLHITDIEVLRLHYAETLKDWRKRFMGNRDRVAAIYDERFCRMWEFYLAGCEAAFRHSGLVVFQIQLSKRVDTVPLTRDYIVEWERSHGLVNPAEPMARTWSLPTIASRTERASESSNTSSSTDAWPFDPAADIASFPKSDRRLQSVSSGTAPSTKRQGAQK